MSTKKPPIGSLSSEGERPRAQVAYEGDDEFSIASLEPERETSNQHRKQLKPSAPGASDKVIVDELKTTNEQGPLGFFRRIFSR
jgi:hypothetical protein